ncbi:unnamed protein product [Closterium sp. Naga37s-1]|nr:unnamed protein product [Closterium sp. Naga37s-1]
MSAKRHKGVLKILDELEATIVKGTVKTATDVTFPAKACATGKGKDCVSRDQGEQQKQGIGMLGAEAEACAWAMGMVNGGVEEEEDSLEMGGMDGMDMGEGGMKRVLLGEEVEGDEVEGVEEVVLQRNCGERSGKGGDGLGVKEDVTGLEGCDNVERRGCRDRVRERGEEVGEEEEEWERREAKREGEEEKQLKCTAATMEHALVLEAWEATFSAVNARGIATVQHQKVLRVRMRAQPHRPVQVLLRDDWLDVPVSAGDTVALIGGQPQTKEQAAGAGAAGAGAAAEEGEEERVVIVDVNNGMLILHPDVLISGSRPSPPSSLPTLSTNLNPNHACQVGGQLCVWPKGGAGGESQAEGRGGQLCVWAEGGAGGESAAEGRHCASPARDNAASAGAEDEAWALQQLQEAVPTVLSWVHQFLYPKSSALAAVPFGNRGEQRHMRLAKVVDIEETVWSPRLGLKGRLDVSVRVAVRNKGKEVAGVGGRMGGQQGARAGAGRWKGKASGGGGKGGDAEGEEMVMMPLEVKTGRSSSNQGAGDAVLPAHGRASATSQPGRIPCPCPYCYHVNASPPSSPPPASLKLPLPGGHRAEGAGAAVLPAHGRAAAMEHRAQVMLYCLLMAERALPANLGASLALALIVATQTHPPPTPSQAAIEHRAQVMLYCLLMAERYQQGVSTGLLLNLHNSTTTVNVRGIESMPAGVIPGLGIQVSRRELVGLIIRRNILANDLKRASAYQELPPVLESVNQCNNCSQFDVCSSYFKLQDHTHPASDPSAFAEEVAKRRGEQWGEKDAQFLSHWERLVDMETNSAVASHADIWAMPTEEREATGRCIGPLQLASIKPPEGVLEAAADARAGGAGAGAGAAGAGVGTAGGGGCTQIVGTAAAAVLADGRIGQSRDQWEYTFKRAWSIQNCSNSSSGGGGGGGGGGSQSGSGRLDQTGFAAGDYVPPQFSPPEDIHPDSMAYLSSLSPREINDDQKQAVIKAMSARDYLVVQGGPGAGKSTAVVHLVKALAAGGRSVLVAAHTNTAVDHILLKLMKKGVAVLRVGRPAAVHPDLLPYTLNDRGGGMDVGSVAGMEAVGLGASVVGCTCLGVGCSLPYPALTPFHVLHLTLFPSFPRPIPSSGGGMDVGSVAGMEAVGLGASVVGCTCLGGALGGPVCLGVGQSLFARKRFDVAILDEAGQTTLPDPRARQQGLGVSLLQRLAEAHPEAVAHLSTQYRMCRPVMALANELVYEGRLKCGSEVVSNARLVLPKLDSVLGMGTGTGQTKGGLPLWLQQVVDPEKRLLFLDTAEVEGMQETREKESTCNEGEAAIVARIVASLVAAGLPACDIGVATVYNAQETREKESTCNEGEATIVARIVASLIAAGLPACDIGVATVYNAQVKAQRAALTRVFGRGGGGGGSSGGDGGEEGVKGAWVNGGSGKVDAKGGVAGGREGGVGGEVEVDTVDRFQGRDKACVVFSTVRCNRRGQLGPVLADPSRCNVAITRAKVG